MLLKANAKINLSLKIVSKRKDGYHNLDSIFLPIAIFDTIEVKKSNSNESKVLFNNKVITFDNNICLKIIKYMEYTYKIKDKYIFNIHKNIPIGGGLGGGSADGTAIFKFYLKEYQIKLNKSKIMELLSSFGADLPFFYFNTPSRVKGIGDKITPIKLKNNIYVMLLIPDKGLSTKEVFNQYDFIKSTHKNRNIDKIESSLLLNKLNECQLFNDLEESAFNLYKDLKIIKLHMINLGFNNVLMSGSGATLFSISNDKDKLIKLSKMIIKNQTLITNVIRNKNYI